MQAMREQAARAQARVDQIRAQEAARAEAEADALERLRRGGPRKVGVKQRDIPRMIAKNLERRRAMGSVARTERAGLKRRASRAMDVDDDI